MSGDEASEYLRWLYERYGHAIYCHVRRLLRDADAASDVTQDTFLAFMRSEHLQRKVASPGAWLFKTAKNRAMDWLRRRSRYSGDAFSNPLRDTSEPEGAYDLFLSDAGGLERVDAQQYLDKLKQGEREQVFVAALLRFGADYEVAEVAQELDISRRTVSNYLNRFAERARKRSHRLDGNQEEESPTTPVLEADTEDGSEGGP